MKYIHIDEDGNIGFKVEEIHDILKTDVPISDEIYDKFFNAQANGKYYNVKNINGTTFEEIFEEKVLETVPPQPSEMDIMQAQIDTLALQVLDMLGV